MADSSTLVDRVKIFVESSGIGPFQLGNAVPAFRGSEALVDGLTYSYAVESGSDYEVGQGVYVLAVDQLIRAPTLSSAGGAPVAFPANVTINFTALAADLVAGLAGSGTVTSVQGSGGTTGLTLTGGPITGAGTLTLGGTLGLANGGTGGTDGPTARSGIGLGNVDNTSDANKPVSTPQQAALNAKVSLTDLAASTGAGLVGATRGVTVQTEINDRGTIIPAQTLTAPVVLTTGKHNIGTGRPAPIVMGNQASGIVIPQPGGGDYNYHSQTENMFVTYGSFTNCGDYANDIHFSAYGLSLNNDWWGGQIAAQRIRSSVGHMEIDGEIARSKVGQLFEGESGAQSTVHSMVGGTTELVGACLKADLGIAFYAAKSRAFDKFNALFDDTAFFANASFDACWFEEYGPGTVVFSESGGRVTGLTFNAGAGGGVLDLGTAISPRFASCTFAGAVNATGGYAPIFDSPLLVNGTLYVASDGLMRDVFFGNNATTTSDGQITVQQVGLTLPGYGSNGTSQDHYGVSASHTSLAVAELAGIGMATGLGHENLFTGDINDSGMWPVKTATLTTGQADPWGGTSATLLSGTAGQWVATGTISAITGQKCVVQVLLRAKTTNTKVTVRIDTQNGGTSPFRRVCTYHFTDTRWRIVTLRVDVPATGGFGIGIQYVDGNFDICQPQLSLGYDLPPILRPGQSVPGAFTQIDRRVIRQANAIPVSGNYWAGDEIVYDAATANTRKRKGAICTVGTGSGVGTWVEYGFVANMGSAIANIAVAPTAADYNAILTALRNAGIIAP